MPSRRALRVPPCVSFRVHRFTARPTVRAAVPTPSETKPPDLPERELIDAAVAHVRSRCMDPWGLHGLAHWWRVRHNGLLIADAMGANLRVVRLFAIFHDSHRDDDGHDPDHGPRAADWLRRVRGGEAAARDDCDAAIAALRALTDIEFESLYAACELHTSTLHHDDPTVATCFVADRLDLSRVGRRPDPRLMPAPRHVVDEELINAAIDRQRKGLDWDGGQAIERVWRISVPRR